MPKLTVQIRLKPCPIPSVLISNNNVLIDGREYQFDYVYNQSSSFHEIYKNSLVSVLETVFGEYNCCVMCYGQTGSGKTYTMGLCEDRLEVYERYVINKDKKDNEKDDVMDIENYKDTKNDIEKDLNTKVNLDLENLKDTKNKLYVKKDIDTKMDIDIKNFPDQNVINENLIDDYFGIVPDSIQYIFTKTSSISLTFIEIYNEEVIDLLSNFRTPINLRQSKSGLSVISTSITCTSKLHTIQILKQGIKNRIVRSTKMNLNSSRSHAILTITINNTKLTFVDLAGSERLKKLDTHKIKETISINSGLLALSNVITALAKKSAYVPFRDSKLTRVLKSNLVNCNTLMLACIAGDKINTSESLNTLKYAHRAMNIDAVVKKNVELGNKAMIELKNENLRLKYENERLKQLLKLGCDKVVLDENQRLKGENEELKRRVKEFEKNEIKYEEMKVEFEKMVINNKRANILQRRSSMDNGRNRKKENIKVVGENVSFEDSKCIDKTIGTGNFKCIDKTISNGNLKCIDKTIGTGNFKCINANVNNGNFNCINSNDQCLKSSYESTFENTKSSQESISQIKTNTQNNREVIYKNNSEILNNTKSFEAPRNYEPFIKDEISRANRENLEARTINSNDREFCNNSKNFTPKILDNSMIFTKNAGFAPFNLQNDIKNHQSNIDLEYSEMDDSTFLKCNIEKLMTNTGNCKITPTIENFQNSNLSHQESGIINNNSNPQPNILDIKSNTNVFNDDCLKNSFDKIDLHKTPQNFDDKNYTTDKNNFTDKNNSKQNFNPTEKNNLASNNPFDKNNSAVKDNSSVKDNSTETNNLRYKNNSTEAKYFTDKNPNDKNKQIQNPFLDDPYLQDKENTSLNSDSSADYSKYKIPATPMKSTNKKIKFPDPSNKRKVTFDLSKNTTRYLKPTKKFNDVLIFRNTKIPVKSRIIRAIMIEEPFLTALCLDEKNIYCSALSGSLYKINKDTEEVFKIIKENGKINNLWIYKNQLLYTIENKVKIFDINKNTENIKYTDSNNISATQNISDTCNISDTQNILHINDKEGFTFNNNKPKDFIKISSEISAMTIKKDYLIVGTEKGSIHIYDLRSKEICIHTEQIYTQSVRSIVKTNDTMYIGSNFLHIQTGTNIKRFEIHSNMMFEFNDKIVNLFNNNVIVFDREGVLYNINTINYNTTGCALRNSFILGSKNGLLSEYVIDDGIRMVNEYNVDSCIIDIKYDEEKQRLYVVSMKREVFIVNLD